MLTCKCVLSHRQRTSQSTHSRKQRPELGCWLGLFCERCDDPAFLQWFSLVVHSRDKRGALKLALEGGMSKQRNDLKVLLRKVWIQKNALEWMPHSSHEGTTWLVYVLNISDHDHYLSFKSCCALISITKHKFSKFSFRRLTFKMKIFKKPLNNFELRIPEMIVLDLIQLVKIVICNKWSQ